MRSNFSFSIFCFVCVLLFSLPSLGDTPILRNEQLDITINEIQRMIFNQSYKLIDNKFWYLDYDDSDDDNDKIYACVRCIDSDKKTERVYEIPEVIKKLRLDKTIKYYPFNPPIECTLDISPTGKYFLVKVFADASYLYETDTGKLIDIYSGLTEKKSDEIIIGFNRQGDLYCGVQDINPMFLLRSITTGKKLKDYTFRNLNFPPDGRGILSSLIEKNDINEVGIIYNYLSEPVESADGKYTVFTFTLFQLRCLFAIILVGDNEKGKIISKHIVDTSDWDIYSSKFVFNKDSTKLLFQDGRRQIKLLDLEREHVTSVFTVPIQLRNNNSSTIANVINTFFFIPSGEVVVCMKMPRGGYANLGSMSPPEKPLVLSYLWNPDDGKIKSPKWRIPENYTLKYWISTDGKTIASFDVKFDPKNFMINNRMNCKEGIIFWDVESAKILHKIDGYIESVSITDDWEKLEIISFDKFPQDYNEKIKAAKITYNLQKLISLRNNNAKLYQSISVINSNYRYWESFDGQYSITARLISIDRVDKTKIDDIDLNKLKDTIVTIEKEANKKLIEVTFGNLSKKDQNYLLEQIKKQK